MDIKLSVSWALGEGRAEALDNRLAVCLEAIEEAGSLAAAARHTKVSYRHLWGLLERWEQQCGAPLVRLQRGRGANLTPLGRALLESQQRIQNQLAPELARLAAQAGRHLSEILATGPERILRIAASHDLALGLVRKQLSRKTGQVVELKTLGSLDSLRTLSGGHCDLAGFHISAPLTGTRHLAQLRENLDARRHSLIRLASRHQGLMVAAGNPLELTALADVAGHQARFINRQPGSGTRLLVDTLLKQAGITPDRLPGYANEEYTHLAVAAMIASGAADAGFGIEAAARQFKLGFVSAITEHYWLAVDTQRMPQSQLQILVEVLQSELFQREVRLLAGYQPEGAGQQVAIEQVFSVRG